MPRIEMYSSAFCPYCMMAKRLLDGKGVTYEVHTVDGQPALRQEMAARAGGRYTVPQILVDDQPLGGFDDIAALDRDGRLDALLGPAPASEPDARSGPGADEP